MLARRYRRGSWSGHTLMLVASRTLALPSVRWMQYALLSGGKKVADRTLANTIEINWADGQQLGNQSYRTLLNEIAGHRAPRRPYKGRASTRTVRTVSFGRTSHVNSSSAQEQLARS